MATTEEFDKDIDRVFAELLSLGEKARREGVTLLDTELDKSVPTYYQKRSKARMTPGDFEAGGCSSADDLEGELARLWRDGEPLALAALAPRMAKLGRSMRSVEDETADVPSFIYVMY